MKQHYVPQFYFKNFGEKVFCLDKTNDNIFQTPPKNIAFEPDFYGPSINGEYPLEKALSQLEGRFSVAISELVKIQDVTKISLKSRLDIAAFIAIQYLRSKETRERIQELCNSVADWVTSQMGIGDHEIKLTDEGTMGMHLEMLKDFPSFAATISQMKFIVMKNSTKIPFWTSDNPVALQNEYNQSPFGNLGIASKGIELWIPITPNLLLAACDPTMYRILPDIMEINDEQVVIRNNWLQVISSTRFLISNTNEFHMAHDMLESDKELRNPKRQRVSHGLRPETKIVKNRPEFWIDPDVIEKTRKKFEKRLSYRLKLLRGRLFFKIKRFMFYTRKKLF